MSDRLEERLHHAIVIISTDADKAVQHASPFSFPWPLGSQFSMMGLSELKAAISLENDSVASSERQRIMKWTVDDVMSHVRSLGCTEQAKIFADQVSKALFYRNDEDQFCLRFQANFFPQNFCYAYGKVLVIVIKRIRENGMREI